MLTCRHKTRGPTIKRMRVRGNELHELPPQELATRRLCSLAEVSDQASGGNLRHRSLRHEISQLARITRQNAMAFRMSNNRSHIQE